MVSESEPGSFQLMVSGSFNLANTAVLLEISYFGSFFSALLSHVV